MLTRRTVLLRHWDVFLGVGQKCINTPRDGLSRARSVRRLKVSTVGTYCSNRSETRREYCARVAAYIRSLDLKATSIHSERLRLSVRVRDPSYEMSIC